MSPDLEYRMLLSLEEIDNGVAVAPGDDAEMSASERRRVLLALDARLAALAAELDAAGI
jgi:hypothetical protein